jgi:hypothetical protein
MKAADLRIGSIVKASFLKSNDGMGIIISCTEKQIVIEQKHDTVEVVNNLASGRTLKLKQITKKVSRVNFQKLLDGKFEHSTAEIISL